MTLPATSSYVAPSGRVLDLFALPAAASALPGSRGAFVAGDLVLSRVPQHDRVDRTWLAPTLARLAVTLDEEPDRGAGALRIAVPVPARDGSIVVEGWEAHRFEPGTRVVEDPDTVRAAGRLLHARLAGQIARPVGIDLPDLPRFSRLPAEAASRSARSLIRQTELLRATMPSPPQSASQLVHASLPGRVLLDDAGSPVILQMVAAWDTAGRADARSLVQSIAAGLLDATAIDGLSLVERIHVLDVLPDLIAVAQPDDLAAYARVLGRAVW